MTAKRLLVLGLAWGLLAGALRAEVPEVMYPADKYKLLEQFEAFQLGKADKAYAGGNFRSAAAEYAQFIEEFRTSKARPYALLRWGRCLQRDNKKYEAIATYSAVVEEFIEDACFAAPALYFKGECYWEAQDFKGAYKAWAAMAEDKDCRQQPWAGTALKRLADNLLKLGRFDEAVKYYWLVILDPKFRGSMDRNDVTGGIDQILVHYMRRKPNEAKLREYYTQANGFDPDPHQIAKDLEGDWEYWAQVRRRVWGYGQFGKDQDAERAAYFKYWADKLTPIGERHFGKHDDFLLDVANLAYQSYGVPEKHHQRLDAIFAKNATDENWNSRVAAWVRFCNGFPPKIKEYVDKFRWEKASGKATRDLLFALADVNEVKLAKAVYPRIKLEELSFDERFQLLGVIWDRLQDPEMGRNLFGKLGLDKEGDQRKTDVGRWFWKRDPDAPLKCYAMMQDVEWAMFNRLGFHEFMDQLDKALAAGAACTKFERFANQAWWALGRIHERKGEWEAAVGAYRNCQEQPASLYQIAACYKNWGRERLAINQLREIENLFKGEEGRAAWLQAVYYREFGQDENETKMLYKIMHLYPTYAEASPAHQRLQEKGLKTDGGIGKGAWEHMRDDGLKD